MILKEISIKHQMSSKAIDYLRSYKFKPHIHGNGFMYGLNGFGCDSTITFKHQPDVIWRFMYFEENGKTAYYTNIAGEQRCISAFEYSDDIIRMQIAPPDRLDPALENYLIDLNAYNTFCTKEKPSPPKPEITNEIAELLKKTGYTANEWLSVIGDDARGSTYFDTEKLC